MPKNQPKVGKQLINYRQTCFSFEVHFEWVNIQPFYDGNGRTSLLLMNILQNYWHLPLVIVFVENEVKYIEAILPNQKNENTEAFVGFMLEQYQKHLLQIIQNL